MQSKSIHLCSIGHSNHPLERFLELLKQREIQALADIRRFPGSRKHPHFGREQLEAALCDAGIEYRWIELLGGRRSAKSDVPSRNLGLRNASFRNYADDMATPEFRQGVDALLDMDSAKKTAMMCAAGLWWQCHRRLVSDWLIANDAQVTDILPDSKLKQHEPTAEVKMQNGAVTYPAPKTLFPEEADA